jgi:hypothetical protein
MVAVIRVVERVLVHHPNIEVEAAVHVGLVRRSKNEKYTLLMKCVSVIILNMKNVPY